MQNIFAKTFRFKPRLSLKSPEKKTNWRIVLYGSLFSCLIFGLAAYQPTLLSYLDNNIYDVMHRSLTEEGSPLPVIVDIDEKSLAEFGQWPWPRYHIAQLFEKLAAAGATSIGVDIIFSETDRTSLQRVQRDLQKGLGISLDLEGIPPRMHDNDALLAEALGRGPFVLGYKFLAAGDRKVRQGLIPLNIIMVHDSTSPGTGIELHGGSGLVVPLSVFAKAVSSTGFVNVRPDDDGIIRRIPLLMRFGNKIYPSLALATVMQAANEQKVFLKITRIGAESLRVKDTIIPVDASGNLLIRYRGKRKSFEYISASDILNDRIDAKIIADRIVFVGATAIGLKDNFATPLDSLICGISADRPLG